MDRIRKRLHALLLVLLFCVTALGSVLPGARAEEIADAYVLGYDGAVEGYAYSGMPYMYKSPFRMCHSYNDPAANSAWTNTYTGGIFQLINTTKLSQGGEGTCASIGVCRADAATGVAEPFFITVPGTAGDGTGSVYTISVSPGNTPETGPDIRKDVTAIDNNSDTFDALEPHTWIIRGGIPVGLGSAKKYVFSDTLDSRLTYTRGSPVVKLYTKAGKELELSLNTHYALAEGTLTDQELPRDHFAISLTREGMTYVMANLGEDPELPELRVYYQACINANADLGTEIPIQARLDYVNSSGIEYKAESDAAEVHTGGIHLLKTDVNGEPLAGAQFRIARPATGEELADPEVETEKLTVDDRPMDVVFVSFYPQDELIGEKVNVVTTDENGNAAFCGLAYGTYYIVETKAPPGCNLLSQPIEARINALSHLTGEEMDSTILVVNTRFILPQTGGIGAALFTVLGIGIMSCAAILLLLNYKKGSI